MYEPGSEEKWRKGIVLSGRKKSASGAERNQMGERSAVLGL